MFFVREETVAEEAFPVGRDAVILCSVRRHGRETVLAGESLTSIRGSTPSMVTILDGDQIAVHLPWLVTMYEMLFREISQRLSRRQLFVANQKTSGINVNLLRGQGAHYEKHRNSNPVTGLASTERAK